MNNERRKLALFLKEVSGWDWQEFLKAEKDPKYTTRESIVFATIRAAAMENLPAITTAISRLDGKVVTPVQVIMPKVYRLFPNATRTENNIEGHILPDDQSDGKALTILTQEEMDEELPTQSFRDTMEKMAGKERALPDKIIKCQEAWEEFSHNRGRVPVNEKGEIDTVKVSSVVAARLLRMAQNRDMKALDEVFNQLDGKLVETIRIVGEDMYLLEFGEVAPAGSIRNEDGIYQIEVPQMSRMWGERLDPAKKNMVQATIIEQGGE